MHSIVPLIEQNDGLWNADEAGLMAPPKHFLPSHVDNRTMAEIYSDLPSPTLNPLANRSTTLSHRVASGDAIWGLRTTLYSYQRHSVAVMLHKESSTSPVLDPLYIAASCMTGTRCYIQPLTMSVLLECPTFSPSQSGILCEELGTGKTVMIIALVLMTAKQLPDPEESLVDERPVMTPLAYCHFPSAEYALARDRAGLGWRAIQQVPTLVELLVHYFSLSKATTGGPAFTDQLEASHLWPFIRVNKPFYHHYNTELAAEALRRPRRRITLSLCPRTMYLSSSTLVIVPLTLLGQWKTEIDKHCGDCVRYLIVRPSMDLPDARKLASDYEVSGCMMASSFHKEFKKNKVEKLHDLKSCTCPCLAGSRIPDCHCPGDPDVTPLLQVRWKRLVIDEGHIAGNMAATINHFVRQLSIQHKWIVTGTPTSNILGLKLGRTTDDQESDNYVDSVESDLDYSHSGSPMATPPSQDDGYHVRIWSSYDRLNLRKLGAMIGDFLAVPQFRTDPKSFTVHVSTPLCDRRGPQPGAIDILSQVMQMVMVRHRIEDVENDVLLPPMKHDMIYMDLDNYALKSYNAMQASLVINAVDSKREGTPRANFHPILQFSETVISRGLFWSSSDILYNVDEICHLADGYMDRAVDRVARREARPEDLDLLQQALEQAAAAANDEIWRAMQPYSDIPFKVSGLDSAIIEAWTRTGLHKGMHMHPDRLLAMRSLVRKKPLISRDDLIEEGNILNRNEKRTFVSKSISSREAEHRTNQTREMVQEVQETIELLKKRVERVDVSDDEELEDRQDGDRVNQVTPTEATAAHVTRSLPLAGVKVGPSLSTKLNYILSEVQRYSVEKFLIFSNSLLTLSQISEALALYKIKYLRYTNQEQYLLREQCITTFETSVVHRVLLMELKLGARGLNLISASRIIFCEPVWHPDVESQAIKRVHRIGQTRPVTVKTLVTRSTAEEAMIARRQYLRNGDKIPNMTTESGMRDYLAHPRFLSESTSNDPISVVLSLDDDHTVSVDMQSNSSGDVGGSSRVDVDSDIPTYESEGGGTIARKRFYVTIEFTGFEVIPIGSVMLAIVTHNGTSLIDPASFKSSSSSFPISSSLTCSTSAWSPDNSQLYLANSSSIKRYTPSECLLEELYYGSDTVTCLAIKDKSSTLFFAAANEVWSLDCTHSPGKVVSSLKPHKNTVTRISMSNDGTLLASVSASAVFVHNLTLSSHTQLKGLPDRKPVTCCLFHQHSRTRLLLGVGRDIVIYDSMRPSSPLKTVHLPGGGNIVGISASPFSKTLVAAATSNGDVALIDLDKDNGILKTVNVRSPLTCCAFTAEGAAIYLGTESGKLLILDLRSLEKEPKSFTIGDGGGPIKAVNIQGKTKSHLTDTASMKVKSSSAAVVGPFPQRSASSTRAVSTGSVIAGPGVKSPVRVTVASKIRGGFTPKKKLFSPVRSPLSETQNLGLDAQLAASRSPTLFRRVQRSKEQEEDGEIQARPPSPTSCGLTELANARQRTKPSTSHKVRQDIERLGLGCAPESISGHLAAMRVRSGPPLNGGSRDGGTRPKNTTRRIISESVESASIGRKLGSTSTGSGQGEISTSKAVNEVVGRTRQKQERRSTTPDNIDGRLDLSSPELPREPVTPISFGKNGAEAPLVSATNTGVCVLGLTSPEVAKWAKGESQKGKRKEKVIGIKRTRFSQHPDAKESSRGSDESEDEDGPEIPVDEQRDEEREQELSLQVSPCRPTAPPTWLQSPHRPSAANLNMNAAAQDFLRSIVHDVMYDFQRETKAEMMGLHLDLVRMGRGWKQELREIMEEWNGEIRELKAENRRLKEENERLQRGY
ncbi:hypothetical protein J3R83DRAFT_4791 [Lanmaoa asiatica]|nr:hypothetical protein J3R83DRAFT_4791 [Lanmaoa asiatica]